VAKEKKLLWAFNWKGGGYNQVYAYTHKKALEEIDRLFKKPDSSLDSTRITNFRIVDEEKYWNSLPLFD